MSELTERLAEAAVAAIRNERPSLEHDANRLRGLVIELTVANNGAVIDGRAWIERKLKPRRD